jgi:hypothetical protein
MNNYKKVNQTILLNYLSGVNHLPLGIQDVSKLFVIKIF